MSKKAIKPSLKNPLAAAEEVEFTIPGEVAGAKGGYEEVMQEGYDLIVGDGVLYASGAVNITEEVLRAVEADFQATSAAQ